MESKFKSDENFSKILDKNDPLGHLRKRFYTKAGVIYMCGNSMGLASKDAEESVLEAIALWKEHAIQLWGVNDHKYYLYSRHLAKLMAPIVNADPEEIAVMETVTVNIHQVISTFYKPTNERFKIIVDDINFPTDKYAIDGQVRLRGLDPKDAVKVVKANNNFLNEDAVIDAMTDDVALVFLPAVYYRTAQVVDMKKITDAAKQRGIYVGWDFCHAVGAIETDLKSLDADFAVWCTYKYLNGGPGSNAALYINKKHFTKLPGLPGWFGNKPKTQFLLKQHFEHQQDASGWQIGTPNVLSMATLEGGLKIFQETNMSDIRKKSLHLTEYLMYLVEDKLSEYGVKVGNLRDNSRRGGHVCLEHDEAYRISMALKSRGVIPDFRPPNIIRVTPTALYTSYAEVYEMVEILHKIFKNETYNEFSSQRSFVV